MVQARIPQPHPDAARATRRMPYEQLRALVVSLVEAPPGPGDGDDDDAMNEFETQRTTCLPRPRTSTLDQLIAALPRYGRVARGSSAHLPSERVSAERDPAYIARPATRPATRPDRAAEPPRKPRDRARTGGGRGSRPR